MPNQGRWRRRGRSMGPAAIARIDSSGCPVQCGASDTGIPHIVARNPDSSLKAIENTGQQRVRIGIGVLYRTVEPRHLLSPCLRVISRRGAEPVSGEHNTVVYTGGLRLAEVGFLPHWNCKSGSSPMGFENAANETTTVCRSFIGRLRAGIKKAWPHRD